MKNFASFLVISALVVSATAQSQKPPSGARPEDATATAQDKSTGSGTRIKGRVVADGHAVPEASILNFPVNLGGNLESTITTLFSPVISDADGKFEISGLRPGAYTMSATAPGYVLSDQDSKTFYRPGDTVTLTLVKGGVITGKVTNSSGDPLVGATVRAIRVKGTDDKPQRAASGIMGQMTEAMSVLLGPYKTDDRGIYRIYGLAPGTYQIAAGGRGSQGFSMGGSNAFDGDAPTYYPSSTLDTAGEVSVVAGAEVTNIDIRYRNNRGYSVSGSVTVATGTTVQGTSVFLARASNGIVEGTTTILSGRNENKFAFESLLEGEYVIYAMGGAGNLALGAEGMSMSISESHRVTVRGADVTGVQLTLEPLGSIAGRAVLESLQDPKQKAECKDARPVPLEGIVLSARDQRKPSVADPFTSTLAEFKNTTPNDKGEFVISLLRPGLQHLDFQLPGEHLYVKSLMLAQTDPKAKPIDAARNGITMRSGDKVKGLVMTVTEGAAGLRGKVISAEDNKPPAVKMRVHLVPSEPEAADEVLRYAEGDVASDGSFSLTNLAPGKYWLVARENSDQDQSEAERKPLAWDAGARVGLRFEGEGSKKMVELNRCQRVRDFVLSYTPLTKPTKSPARKPGR
ncbi:MAG TPA: carboxypeptidase regulatory-like domain-containing protein [Blastocatellia bacterium]|nr:carboxypeptidase regulatory-like domain-containing protein [Blastocatellia bacterium]